MGIVNTKTMALSAMLMLGCHGAAPLAMTPESSFDAQGCVEEALRGRATEPYLLREAHRHFDEACADLDEAACSTLGLFHEYGWVERPDAYEAARLYRFACAAGNQAGCVNLAVLFVRGEGGVSQMGMGRILLASACEQNDARACLELGRSELRLGDATGAARHLGAACDAGTGEACVLLASTATSPASGAESNAPSATALYQRACSYGYQLGCAELDRRFHSKRRMPAPITIAACGMPGQPCAAGGPPRR